MNFPPPSPRQARLMWAALSGLAIAVLVSLVAGLIWGLAQVLRVLSPVLWPLAIAGVLAYLLDPVVDFLERKKIPRTRAIIFVFALALVLAAGLFTSVVPQLISESRDLIKTIPVYIDKSQKRIEHWVSNPPAIATRLLGSSFFKRETNAAPATAVTNAQFGDMATNTPAPPDPGAPSVAGSTNASDGLLTGSLDQQTIQNATGLIAKYVPQIGSWVFGQVGRVASWFGVLAGLSLIPVYAFYLLLEKRGIRSHWTQYLPVSDSRFKDELVFVIGSINDYLIAFFRGQVLVAICDGILYTIGFIAIGLPYAVLVGVMATFLTIIPFIGAIVTCLTALIIMLVQHGDWQHPLYVLIVFAIVQTLEGLVISPKIMGDKVGLHPVTIIIAVMVGTTLMGGLLGGILAIPLTAALRVVMFRYIWKRRDRSQAA